MRLLELELIQVQFKIIGCALFEPHEIGSSKICQILRNDWIEGDIELQQRQTAISIDKILDDVLATIDAIV